MKITFTANLQGVTRYDKQADVYVGWCPALNIYSQGRDEKHAMTALESTVRLYLVTCYKKNILHAVLTKAGFNAVESPFGLSAHEAAQDYISIEERSFGNVFDFNVPLELVAAASLGGKLASSRSCSASSL